MATSGGEAGAMREQYLTVESRKGSNATSPGNCGAAADRNLLSKDCCTHKAHRSPLAFPHTHTNNRHSQTTAAPTDGDIRENDVKGEEATCKANITSNFLAIHVLTRVSAFATSETVIVKVGAKAKTYTLHKKLLTFHSGFFRGAFSGTFKEATEGVVSLKETATELFDVFVDWIYEKTLPHRVWLIGSPISADNIGLAVESYLMSDMLMADGLKKAIFDQFFDMFVRIKSSYVLDAVVTWCEVLPETDPIIQLLIDTYCVKQGSVKMPVDSLAALPQLPKDVLIRILLKQNELGQLKKHQRKLDREDYVFPDTNGESTK
ncbi:hypothetical protein NX059_008944 [Plenodomus lindquistii]|nr:hypothetical protein NX059_008944 [Plenodomus lindquistii]